MTKQELLNRLYPMLNVAAAVADPQNPEDDFPKGRVPLLHRLLIEVLEIVVAEMGDEP